MTKRKKQINPQDEILRLYERLELLDYERDQIQIAIDDLESICADGGIYIGANNELADDDLGALSDTDYF